MIEKGEMKMTDYTSEDSKVENLDILDGMDLSPTRDKIVKIAYKQPGKPLETRVVPTSLEEMQRLVNGWIEIVYAPFCDDLDMVVNEEGKFMESEEPNFFMPEFEDLIVGSAVFIGYDPDLGEHVSITDSQLEEVEKYIAANDVGDKKVNKEDYVNYKIYVL